MQQPPEHEQPAYEPEDEIDLADLAAVLHRQRWLIGAVTGLVALLGAAYSFLVVAENYSYRTLVEIGQYQGTDGTYKYVETPKAAAERLKAASQTLYHQRQGETGATGGVKFGLGSLAMETTENGGVVEMSLEAPLQASVRSFFDEVVARLIKDHNRIFEVEEQQIRQRIQSQEANLKELKQKVESDRRRLELLKKEKAFLKEQIQESTARIDQLLKTKAQANLSGSGTEPVGLLLFSSEIQRVRSYIDELRTRLMSGIPSKREDLQVSLESTQSSITTTRAKLQTQKTALASVSRTRFLLEPTVSDSPVSPNHKLNLALSLVLGLFLSVFVAFLYEFWRNNRERILAD